MNASVVKIFYFTNTMLKQAYNPEQKSSNLTNLVKYGSTLDYLLCEIGEIFCTNLMYQKASSPIITLIEYFGKLYRNKLTVYINSCNPSISLFKNFHTKGQEWENPVTPSTEFSFFHHSTAYIGRRVFELCMSNGLFSSLSKHSSAPF